MMRLSTSLMTTMCLGLLRLMRLFWPALRRILPPVLPNGVGLLSLPIARPVASFARMMGDLLRSSPSPLVVWLFLWPSLLFVFHLRAVTLLSRLCASEGALSAGTLPGVLVMLTFRVPLGRVRPLLRLWTRLCKSLALLGLGLIVLPRLRLLGPPLWTKALCLLADRLLRSGFLASTFHQRVAERGPCPCPRPHR